MKSLAILPALMLYAFAAHAEIRTITLDTSVTNASEIITITAQQTIEFKMDKTSQGCGSQALVWTVNGLGFTNLIGSTAPMFVAGPASVRIVTSGTGCPANLLFATFDIQPSAFPPDKALTLGAFTGNVKVTLEQSTDLVIWTQAESGLIYTNAPDARFFRIRAQKNAP